VAQRWYFRISPVLAAAPVDSLVHREDNEVDIEGFLTELAGELSCMKRAAYTDWSHLLLNSTVTWQAFEPDSHPVDKFLKSSCFLMN
jgi:hypothetical protein